MMVLSWWNYVQSGEFVQELAMFVLVKNIYKKQVNIFKCVTIVGPIIDKIFPSLFAIFIMIRLAYVLYNGYKSKEEPQYTWDSDKGFKEIPQHHLNSSI